jgi:cytochrome c oxidase subunit 2
MSQSHRDRAAAAASRVALLLAATGCGAPMEIFSSASEPAARVTRLTWFMVILAAAVYVLVIAAMAIAVRRRRDAARLTTIELSDPGVKSIVIAGMVIPSLILSAVFVVAETAMGKYPDPRSALTVNVIAHQWWWEVEYAVPRLSQRFRTANEIHIPVGQPVRLLLTTADVIHSFWVPQLQGKIDIIPGDTNDLRLMARRPGVYRGQCAEFCGMQHGNMAMVVIAEDSASYARWLAGQIADPPPPADTLAATGQRLFADGACAMCHTVRGTPARATVGPDLTHVGSRLTLGAGTIPNPLGNLQGWIANAQAFKPGAKMPRLAELDGPQLRAIAAYVAGLR